MSSFNFLGGGLSWRVSKFKKPWLVLISQLTILDFPAFLTKRFAQTVCPVLKISSLPCSYFFSILPPLNYKAISCLATIFWIHTQTHYDSFSLHSNNTRSITSVSSGQVASSGKAVPWSGSSFSIDTQQLIAPPPFIFHYLIPFLPAHLNDKRL